jgi:hypothetical protein
VESKTYISDLLHDGLDSLKSVFTDSGHLLGELRILTTLPLLIGLVFRHLLLDVLQKGNLSDLVAVIVNDIAIVVNLKTSAVAKVTSSEATDEIAVLIADFTLLVDTHASHGVDPALLLLGFPALGLTDDVAVLIIDITILIDLVALKLLDVALDNTTNDLA